MKVTQRWSLAPCSAPTSLAIDRKSKRLFAGCGNRMLAVVNAEDGDVIATLPIGEKVDATAFDSDTKMIISSNGDGTMTVIHQDDADHYHVVRTIKTPKRSKTFALDRKTHKLFVPAAEFAAPVTLGARPAVTPGSFKVLVYQWGCCLKLRRPAGYIAPEAIATGRKAVAGGARASRFSLES